jgi:hypothetical protein
MPIEKNGKREKSSGGMSVPLLATEGKGPPNNQRRTPSKPVVPPEVSVPAQVSGTDSEVSGDAAADTSQFPEPKTEKKLTYAERLEEAGISKQHAREVMDAVLFQEKYEETVDWRPGFPVTLCTRAYADTLRLMRVIEVENPNWPMHVEDIIARYNVCASLRRYGEKIITPLEEGTPKQIEEDFEQRLNFVLKLPEVAINKLITEMRKFDLKMAVIFSDGSIKDF